MGEKPGSSGDQHGAAVVEMAFVAIFLVLLVAGVVDLGRALYTNIGVQDAAQEGATYASRAPGDGAGIRQRAIDATTYPQLTAADIEVTCPDGVAGSGGELVSVEATHTLDLFTPVIGDMLGGSITLARQFTVATFGGECLIP